MNTWLSAIMLVSTAAGFAVCAGGLVHRGRRRHVGRKAAPSGGGTPDGGTPGTAVVGMAVMLVAMGDMALDAVQLLPGVVWGLLMLPAGPLLLAGGHPASRPSHCGFGMHRSLSMIAMAALTIAGGHGHSAGPVPAHVHGGSGVLPEPPVLPVLLVVGVGALLAYTAVLVVAQYRALPRTVQVRALPARRRLPHRGIPLRDLRLPTRPVVESFLAAVSVTAMAGAILT